MGSVVQLVDVNAARGLLKQAIPEWEWLVARLESTKGQLRFPRQLSEAIKNLKIQTYPLLYENERSIGITVAMAFCDLEDLREFDQELREATVAQRGKTMLELVDVLDSAAEGLTFPKTSLQTRAAQDAFAALSEEEQASATKFWQFFLSGTLAMFFEYLSVMVHGEKLTGLVAQAKAGDQTAFAKAIQIDKRILTTVPYFVERYAQAGMDSDTNFLEEIGRRIGAPPYLGKIRHKSLWLMFAVLDACGVLDDFAHGDLLDLCDDIGIGRHKARIDDVKNLSKRLAEYRRFQQRGMIIESTP